MQKHKDLRTRSKSKRQNRSPALNPVARTQINEFWKNLLNELRHIIDALHEIDSVGSVNTFGGEIVRISLSDDATQAITTRTDLVLDGERIRCSVFNGGIYYLNFVALSDDRIFVQDIQRADEPMDAQKTAEHVIDRMLNIIEWSRI